MKTAIQSPTRKEIERFASHCQILGNEMIESGMIETGKDLRQARRIINFLVTRLDSVASRAELK